MNINEIIKELNQCGLFLLDAHRESLHELLTPSFLNALKSLSPRDLALAIQQHILKENPKIDNFESLLQQMNDAMTRLLEHLDGFLTDDFLRNHHTLLNKALKDVQTQEEIEQISKIYEDNKKMMTETVNDLKVIFNEAKKMFTNPVLASFDRDDTILNDRDYRRSLRENTSLRERKPIQYFHEKKFSFLFKTFDAQNIPTIFNSRAYEPGQDLDGKQPKDDEALTQRYRLYYPKKAYLTNMDHFYDAMKALTGMKIIANKAFPDTYLPDTVEPVDGKISSVDMANKASVDLFLNILNGEYDISESLLADNHGDFKIKCSNARNPRGFEIEDSKNASIVLNIKDMEYQINLYRFVKAIKTSLYQRPSSRNPNKMTDEYLSKEELGKLFALLEALADNNFYTNISEFGITCSKPRSQAIRILPSQVLHFDDNIKMCATLDKAGISVIDCSRKYLLQDNPLLNRERKLSNVSSFVLDYILSNNEEMQLVCPYISNHVARMNVSQDVVDNIYEEIAATGLMLDRDKEQDIYKNAIDKLNAINVVVECLAQDSSLAPETKLQFISLICLSSKQTTEILTQLISLANLFKAHQNLEALKETLRIMQFLCLHKSYYESSSFSGISEFITKNYSDESFDNKDFKRLMKAVNTYILSKYSQPGFENRTYFLSHASSNSLKILSFVKKSYDSNLFLSCFLKQGSSFSFFSFKKDEVIAQDKKDICDKIVAKISSSSFNKDTFEAEFFRESLAALLKAQGLLKPEVIQCVVNAVIHKIQESFVPVLLDNSAAVSPAPAPAP